MTQSEKQVLGFDDWFEDYEDKFEVNARILCEDAWKYRQAEVDAIAKQRDSFIKAHHIAMNDVCSQKSEIDGLQKRINDALNEFEENNDPWASIVDEVIKILKGETK